MLPTIHFPNKPFGLRVLLRNRFIIPMVSFPK